jgi:hypothetical protein
MGLSFPSYQCLKANGCTEIEKVQDLEDFPLTGSLLNRSPAILLYGGL